MPLYIADYRADTAHLSAAQHGAYLLLIMHYWTTGGLPDDDGALARIACMTAAEWRKHRPVIAALFSPGWKHKRIEFELSEAARISEAGRAGGKASAVARRAAKEQRSANDPPTIVQRSFNETGNDPPTKSQALKQPQPQPQKRASPSTARKGDLPVDFELSEADRRFAFDRGWDDHKLRAELQRFRDHASATGRKQADWHAAWRNWVTSPYQQNGNSDGRMEKTGGRRRGSALDALDKLFGPRPDVDAGDALGDRKTDLRLPEG